MTAQNNGEAEREHLPQCLKKQRATGIVAVVSYVAGDKRRNAHARLSIGTTFPPLPRTRGTTAALASSSKAVAMYFA